VLLESFLRLWELRRRPNARAVKQAHIRQLNPVLARTVWPGPHLPKLGQAHAPFVLQALSQRRTLKRTALFALLAASQSRKVCSMFTQRNPHHHFI